MANALFELGRQGFLEADIDWGGATNISAALIDTGTSDVGIKQISSSTNATPIVVTTSAAHGFTDGDFVIVEGHATNTAGNGLWKIASASGSVFSLTRPDGTNSVGNGVGGATGYVVNLGPSAAGSHWDDFSAAIVGTKQNMASFTGGSGIADAADVTFTSVTGATVEAVAVFEDTGTETTSQMIAWIDGRHIVTVAADAASSATTVWVEPLAAGIPNSTVLAFSNGASATLSALASQGARSLTVTALASAIAAGHRASALATGSGLPVTPNGGNISVAWDNGANKIFKL